MALQVKLLRVLQEKKMRRLGGNSDIPINARIISATNRDLEILIKEGRFREDLYYRLNVFRLNLPPLRERKEDIPLLSDHLLSRLCVRMGRTKPDMDKGVMESLTAYPFPGNVRELENILERALIYCGGNVIKDEDIDLHRGNPGSQNQGICCIQGDAKTSTQTGDPSRTDNVLSPPVSMGEVEKKAILEALASCKGNRTRAAEILGLSRKTILNKLKSYGL
jgi:two-component system response regulator AtoC